MSVLLSETIKHIVISVINHGQLMPHPASVLSASSVMTSTSVYSCIILYRHSISTYVCQFSRVLYIQYIICAWIA